MKGRIIIAIVLIMVISGCINSGEIDYANKIDAALKDGPVVAYFHADWCAACVPQKPIIEELEREYGGDVTFILINVDEDATAMRKYGVRGIPTTIVFAGEEDYVRHVGATDRGTLSDAIQWAIINHGPGG